MAALITGHLAAVNINDIKHLGLLRKWHISEIDALWC
jgi:hypothetical protein